MSPFNRDYKKFKGKQKPFKWGRSKSDTDKKGGSGKGRMEQRGRMEHVFFPLLPTTTSMTIKLYGFAFSNAVFRAMVTLYEKDLDFEFVPLDYTSGDYKSPEFLARNPFGEVPMFEDGDLKLFESRAITKYIAEMYADKGTELILKDPKRSAIQMVWMEVENTQFDPVTRKLVKELCAKPLFGINIDHSVVAECEQKLANVLDVYEQRLAENKYLGGDSFTLVDLHHQPDIYYLMGTNMKNLFDSRPHVSAWASALLSRPAWLKVISTIPKRT